MKLYELATNYQNLMELLDNPEIPQEIIKESLDQVQGDIAEKLENIAKLVRNIEADVDAFKAEEKRLGEKRRANENRVTNLKHYAEEAMRSTGIHKVKGDLFTFAIQKNPPSAVIADMNQLPEEYFKEPDPPEPDKKHILEDLKNGVKIPGCVLQQTESLRIK